MIILRFTGQNGTSRTSSFTKSESVLKTHFKYDPKRRQKAGQSNIDARNIMGRPEEVRPFMNQDLQNFLMQTYIDYGFRPDIDSKTLDPYVGRRIADDAERTYMLNGLKQAQFAGDSNRFRDLYNRLTFNTGGILRQDPNIALKQINRHGYTATLARYALNNMDDVDFQTQLLNTPSNNNYSWIHNMKTDYGSPHSIGQMMASGKPEDIINLEHIGEFYPSEDISFDRNGNMVIKRKYENGPKARKVGSFDMNTTYLAPMRTAFGTDKDFIRVPNTVDLLPDPSDEEGQMIKDNSYGRNDSTARSYDKKNMEAFNDKAKQWKIRRY